jgi:anti-anti-sigma factor
LGLTLSSRQVGDVTVVSCTGRIVLGEEAHALQRCLDTALPANDVLLHLGGVEFIDSAGLGLLARYVTRAPTGGRMRLCALSPKVEAVMRVTRLKAAFQIDDTEGDSLADLHRTTDIALAVHGRRILCVDESKDVLVFLRELLQNAGYHALTASNFPDALILMKAARPALVVIGSGTNANSTPAAQQFRHLASAGPVIELPGGFSSQDAGDAAQHVLDAIRDLAASAQGDPSLAG